MKFSNLHIERKPFLFLQIGLTIISAALIYTLVYLYTADSSEYYIIMNTGRQLIEHIMMSLTLLVGGTLLFDYVCRKHKS